MKTNKILKIVTGTAILGALCATPAAVLLSHPTTSITANSKMTINSYLADAPVDIDTVIPENSAIGNFMFQPTADGVVSRLATTFPTLDVDQIEVSNVTSSSATVTAVDYAVDYIPGSTTTVTFTIGTQVDLTTVLANDTNLNTANIFKSSNDRFADTSALLTAIKSGLAKQSNPVAFYPNEVSASFTWTPSSDMYICSITSNPDSLIYKGSTEVMFNTYRASLSSAEFTTTDLGNFTNGKSTVVLSKFKSVNKDSEAATIWATAGTDLTIGTGTTTGAPISVIGNEDYTGSVDATFTINQKTQVNSIFGDITSMAFNYVPENPLQVIGELNKLDPAKYGYSVVSYDNLSVLIDNDKETITISALAGNPMYEGTYTFAYTVNA